MQTPKPAQTSIVLPAWEKTAGRSDVIVAVVDEGVEYTHPGPGGQYVERNR